MLSVLINSMNYYVCYYKHYTIPLKLMRECGFAVTIT